MSSKCLFLPLENCVSLVKHPLKDFLANINCQTAICTFRTQRNLPVFKHALNIFLKSNLNNHNTAHAGEKPFSYAMYNKEFSYRSNFRVLLRIHIKAFQY